MTIELFDAQCGFGGASQGSRQILPCHELLESMQRLEIARSLVRIVPAGAMEGAFSLTNARLYDACTRRDGLAPCPIVVPNSGSDVPDEAEQVADAIAHGAGAVCIRPKEDYWRIVDWLSDPLFEALAERRMPLFVSAEALDAEALGELAGRFECLPILYGEMGYRSQRVLLPLVKRFGNVRLIVGGVHCVEGGIEQFVEQVGPERLLFGTGFPNHEPMTAIAHLMYADISDQQKQQIGSGNLAALIGEIRK